MGYNTMNKHSLLGIISACTVAMTLGNSAQAASFIIDDFNGATTSSAESTGGLVTAASAIDSANIVMDATGGGGWTRTLTADLVTGDSMATSVCIRNFCDEGYGYVSMAPGSASGTGIFEYNNDSAIDMSSYTLLGFDWGADLPDAGVDIIFSDGSNTSTVASWSLLAATGGALVSQTPMGIAWGAVDPKAITQIQFVVNGVGNLDSSIDNFVAVVPVPAAAWLFGSALLGLAGVRRGKASASH